VVGLRVLYKARPIHLFPTTTNYAALTVPANIACLLCVIFDQGFPLAALPDPLSRHGCISAEGSLSETFGYCSVEAF